MAFSERGREVMTSPGGKIFNLAMKFTFVRLLTVVYSAAGIRYPAVIVSSHAPFNLLVFMEDSQPQSIPSIH